MNVFVLDEDPDIAAKQQCDKHIPKMVVESGQMLSTAHRMVDGERRQERNRNGRMVTIYELPDRREHILYKAVHYNHPCTVWARESDLNYRWHYRHFLALCNEYTYRYGKEHLTDRRLREALAQPPINIPRFGKRTPFPLAMGSNPECMFPEDPVKSYRLFYQTKQDRFKMEWKTRPVPKWFHYKKSVDNSVAA